MADVRLLRKREGGPEAEQQKSPDEESATHSKCAPAHIARGDHGFAVSHAASLERDPREGCRLYQTPLSCASARLRGAALRFGPIDCIPSFCKLVTIEVFEGDSVLP